MIWINDRTFVSPLQDDWRNCCVDHVHHDLEHVRYVVLDEADRLLASAVVGFEKDVAELLLHCTTRRVARCCQETTKCQTLLFSATLTKSLESIEEMAGAGQGRLPLRKFVIHEDGETQTKKKRKREDKDSDATNEDDESDSEEEE